VRHGGNVYGMGGYTGFPRLLEFLWEISRTWKVLETDPGPGIYEAVMQMAAFRFKQTRLQTKIATNVASRYIC